MREIKFRAYEPETKTMFVPTSIPNPTQSPDRTGSVLMQCILADHLKVMSLSIIRMVLKTTIGWIILNYLQRMSIGVWLNALTVGRSLQ